MGYVVVDIDATYSAYKTLPSKLAAIAWNSVHAIIACSREHCLKRYLTSDKPITATVFLLLKLIIN